MHGRSIYALMFNGNRLVTSVFYKPTNSHSYLLDSSSHRNHTKRSLSFSQFLRLRRLLAYAVKMRTSIPKVWKSLALARGSNQPELFTFTCTKCKLQLLKEHRQVRLSRTTFYGVDCQGKLVDCRGYPSLLVLVFLQKGPSCFLAEQKLGQTLVHFLNIHAFKKLY